MYGLIWVIWQVSGLPEYGLARTCHHTCTLPFRLLAFVLLFNSFEWCWAVLDQITRVVLQFGLLPLNHRHTSLTQFLDGPEL